MRARRILAASVVLAACLLGGCGGREEQTQENAYVAAVNAAQTRFSDSIARAGTNADRSATTVATVDRWTRAVDRMARELGAIDAPDRLDRLHARLVGDVGDFRTALGQAQGALRTGKRATILAERAQLVVSAKRATRDIEATLKSIDRTLRQ